MSRVAGHRRRNRDIGYSMRALATYIMRGRSQAMLAVVGFATLSMIIPLLSYLSAAAVALVTLRLGALPGLTLILTSSAFIGILSLFSKFVMGMMPAMLSLALLVVLLWMLALVLRQTRSLAMTILAAAAVGLVVILGFHAAIGDSVTWWQHVLRLWFGPAIEHAGEDSQQMYLLLDDWAPHMTGFVASAVIVNALLCLFLARWWQAMLYNPGGFGTEYHALQLGRQFAVVTLVVGVLAWIPMGVVTVIMKDVLMLCMTIYVLQGLAVIHDVIARRKMQSAWFIGVYIIVFVMSQLVAMIGFIDTWAELRNRFAPDNKV